MLTTSRAESVLNPLGAITFPLNVYAALLDWTEQRVDHLHLGLFDKPDEPVWQAQARASEVLWATLPPTPCRVLDVGIGLGTMLRRLCDAGYDAVGITPDAAEAALARQRHGPSLPVQTVRLEDLPAPAQPFDVMLLQGSAQYLSPLALFEAADRLMSPTQATLLVMDEFALRRDGPEHTGLRDLAFFVTLAERCGWQLDLDQDLSAQTLANLDVIEGRLMAHGPRLTAELGITPEQHSLLLDSARRYRLFYQQGVYGHRLLRLRRGAPPALAVRTVGAQQAPALRALFQATFGHDLSPEAWHWKFGDDRGHAVVLWQGERIVAHYGALKRRVLLMGQPALACQIGDVMVAPDVNAGLDRKGPFYKTAASLVEEEVGWGRTYPFGFGFPNARAMRVAQRLGLYEPVDAMAALAWTALPPESLPPGQHLETFELAALQEDTQLWHELDAAWQAMAADLSRSVVGVRDPAWLRHRYGRRPLVRYEAALLRRGPESDVLGDVLGAVVLRVHEQAVELLDVVGARRNLFSLVRMARVLSQRWGHQRLQAWLTQSHRDWLDDPLDPAQAEPLDVTVPANAYSRGVPPDQLRDRWFLMAGDTDFR